MQNNKNYIFLNIILISLIISLVILIINKTTNNKQTQQLININNNFCTNIKTIKYPENINILINKCNKLDKNYIPKDLKLINTKYATTNQYLKKDAHNAFITMAKDALKENIHFYAGSTYRSYNYQNKLHNKYILDYTYEIAERFSAKAGHSEHQTGLAVDILNHNWNYLNNKDIEYSWLITNSYKYGFILRYPKNKEKITGYIYEPWHFRYLDKRIAKILYNNKLTYEEYLTKNKQ